MARSLITNQRDLDKMKAKGSILSNKDKGTYLLILELKGNQKISVGKLPNTFFCYGTYVYVGQARNGLQQRLNRHLRKEKKLFWHIDYLLSKAGIKEIWVKRDFFDECLTIKNVKNDMKDSFFPLKKFGSSDCRCPSHLLSFFSPKKDMTSLRNELDFEKVEIYGNQV